MSELGEETRQGQDHGFSGGGDNVRNVRHISSFSNSTHLLPLYDTTTGAEMMRRSRYITSLTLTNKHHEEIPHQTRMNLMLTRIIENVITCT